MNELSAKAKGKQRAQPQQPEGSLDDEAMSQQQNQQPVQQRRSTRSTNPGKDAANASEGEDEGKTEGKARRPVMAWKTGFRLKL